MVDIKKILVAFDRSKYAKEALIFKMRFARQNEIAVKSTKGGTPCLLKTG